MSETDFTKYDFEPGAIYAIHTDPEYDHDRAQYHSDVEFVRNEVSGGPVRIFKDEDGDRLLIDSRFMTKVRRRD